MVCSLWLWRSIWTIYRPQKHLVCHRGKSVILIKTRGRDSQSTTITGPACLSIDLLLCWKWTNCAENGGLLKTENILVINLLIENKVCRSFKYGRFQVRLYCGRQWCHTYGSTRYSGKWTPRSAYQKGAASPQTGKVSLQNLDQESRSLVVT